MSSSSKAKSGNSSSSNGGGPCGACKFLRRKCVKGCVFAPFFDSEQGAAQFAAVHKVFGASNASKMLLRIPPQKRLDAALTLCYEALARLRDPVYGCAAHILDLQHQVVNLQAELALVQAQLFTWQMQRACSSSSSSSSWGPTTDYLHQSSLSLMLSACACACDGSSTLFNPSTSSMELELAAAAAAGGGFCNPINPELSDQNGNGNGDGDGVISVSSFLAASRCLH